MITAPAQTDIHSGIFSHRRAASDLHVLGMVRGSQTRQFSMDTGIFAVAFRFILLYLLTGANALSTKNSVRC